MRKESNLNYLVSSWLSSKIRVGCVCFRVCVCERDGRRRKSENVGERMIRETQGKEKRERLGQVGGERKRESKREKKEIRNKRKRIYGNKTKSLMWIIPINDIYVHVTKLLMDKNPKIFMTCYFETWFNLSLIFDLGEKLERN